MSEERPCRVFVSEKWMRWCIRVLATTKDKWIIGIECGYERA
jgi:hypothetical protein